MYHIFRLNVLQLQAQKAKELEAASLEKDARIEQFQLAERVCCIVRLQVCCKCVIFRLRCCIGNIRPIGLAPYG